MLTAAKPALSTAPLRVLLVGERKKDFFLIREILGRTNRRLSAELDHANSLEEARVMLQQTAYGLILFEYETGDAAAVQLLSDFLQASRGPQSCRSRNQLSAKTVYPETTLGQNPGDTGSSYSRGLTSPVAEHAVYAGVQI